MTLTPANRSTARTRHHADGQLLPKPAALQIVRYPDDPGYYLFYLDETGAEQTDTYHNSIEAAMEQAEYEFGVKPNEWTG